MNIKIQQLLQMDPAERKAEIIARKKANKEACARHKPNWVADTTLISKRKDGSKSVSFTNKKPSLTEQNGARNLSVKEQMEMWVRTGKFTNLRDPKKLVYGDFQNADDYQTSLNRVQAAQEQFAELPDQLRQKFNNSPKDFLQYVTNPDNKMGMHELGLLSPEASQAIVEAQTAERAKKAAEAAKKAESDSQAK